MSEHKKGHDEYALAFIAVILLAYYASTTYGYKAPGQSSSPSVSPVTSSSPNPVSFNPSPAPSQQPNTCAFTVSSAPSDPSLAQTVYYPAYTLVTCTAPITDLIGGTVYSCQGWTGMGSVPAGGVGNVVSFTIAQASSITWNFQPIAQPSLSPSPSPSSSPVPQGDNLYPAFSDSTLCSTDSNGVTSPTQPFSGPIGFRTYVHMETNTAYYYNGRQPVRIDPDVSQARGSGNAGDDGSMWFRGVDELLNDYSLGSIYGKTVVFRVKVLLGSASSWLQSGDPYGAMMGLDGYQCQSEYGNTRVYWTSYPAGSGWIQLVEVQQSITEQGHHVAPWIMMFGTYAQTSGRNSVSNVWFVDPELYVLNAGQAIPPPIP